MCWTFGISNAGGKEIKELKFEKEENDRFYKDEQCKTVNLIEEKGERIAWRVCTEAFSFTLKD